MFASLGEIVPEVVVAGWYCDTLIELDAIELAAILSNVNARVGLVVAIPTKPRLSIKKFVNVDDPIESIGPLKALGCNDKKAHGDVVPIPSCGDPEPFICNAGVAVVAKVPGDEVDINRFPCAFLKLQ